LLAIAWALVAVGCSPPPPPPALVRLRVVTAPSAAPLVRQLAQRYQELRSYVTVQIDEAPAEAALEEVAMRRADLALVERDPRADELVSPEHGRRWLTAWPLASDGVAVVVHPSNPIQALGKADLDRLYEGLERRWERLGGLDAPVELVSREPGAPARIAFERYFLDGKPVAGAAVIMPGDRAVADYVAAHAGAIGYLSLAWVQGNVKVIAVDGVSPTAAAIAGGRYPLSHPLVLVTRTGMASKTRAFLDFAQGAEGQGIVGRMYAPARPG